MAADSLSTWDDLLYELREPLQKLFPREFVLSAEFADRVDTESMSGSQARVPLILSQLQGGGAVAETGTVNSPHTTRTDQAHVNIAEMVFPISITKRLKQQAVTNSAAEAVATLVDGARVGLARIENEMMHGAGNALLAPVTGGSTGSLIVEVSPTATARRQLYPGRIVDVLTRSNGADAGQGLARKIASVDWSTGAVTFDTASQGGGSGNITFSTSSGIYIEGSYGNAMQSIQQVTAQSGSFEGITKDNVVEWQGTDGRGGDSEVVPLTTSILDGAIVELGQRSEAGDSSFTAANYFGVGDPKVLNLFAQGYYNQTRIPIETKTLDTGFAGVAYEGVPLVKDFDAQAGAVRLLKKSTFKMFQFGSGPEFDNATGSMWQRFNRTLSTEAWLYDGRQLGAMQCAPNVEILDLAQA